MNDLFRDHLHGTITQPREQIHTIEIPLNIGNETSLEFDREKFVGTKSKALAAKSIIEDYIDKTLSPGFLELMPWQRDRLVWGLKYKEWQEQDPARYTDAWTLAISSTATFEECWETTGRIQAQAKNYQQAPALLAELRGNKPGRTYFDEWQYFAQDTEPISTELLSEQISRENALEAKAARSSGPENDASWRGRSRNNKYKTK